ncbi:MAG: GMC family oxidoreductase [Gammaproteobacteria bacterium]|nr:GMC family oxidoreductase [Gammaproteobacteria bacterium]
MKDYDVCVIGSGAGGGPVAYTLAEAGYRVLVLEKGPWFTEKDFFKDEIVCCRRSVYTPELKDERHVLETPDGGGSWSAEPTSESGWDFWNGNCVGGSSNFMSGFFLRLKPDDFRLRSTYGAIAGANVVDWPIGYDELEPYYDKVEKLVGVSGKALPHPHADPRSSPDFPFPPTLEHPLADWLDRSCRDLDLHPLPTPRAILPAPALGRQGCAYSGYCGSYGCATGAKGSARAALLDKALASGRCELRPHSMVARLVGDARGQIAAVEYFDKDGRKQRVDARIYVVACQAVETARLLLRSTGPRHPKGLANRHGQVGRNLLFSAGGSGSGDLPYDHFTARQVDELKVFGPFLNRTLQDWYVIDDKALGGRVKGGSVEFLFQHPNPINRADRLKWGEDGLLWGEPLKRKLKAYFTGASHLRFEAFCDWLPTDDCRISLDPEVRDRWGLPVARVRAGYHPHDLKVGEYLAERSRAVLEHLGCVDVRSFVSGDPPSNLQAGGCRFGRDPKTSVLDPDCRAHGIDNLYVSDGSFMPTGGSVPYTFTIYANAFRVADQIVADLGGVRASRVKDRTG